MYVDAVTKTRGSQHSFVWVPFYVNINIKKDFPRPTSVEINVQIHLGNTFYLYYNESSKHILNVLATTCAHVKRTTEPVNDCSNC